MGTNPDGEAADLHSRKQSTDSFSLLHVTTAGKIESLLHNGHTQWICCPLPSPDGKSLAFRALTFDSNVWMIDDF